MLFFVGIWSVCKSHVRVSVCLSCNENKNWEVSSRNKLIRNSFYKTFIPLSHSPPPHLIPQPAMNGKRLTKCARGTRRCRRSCNKQKWVRAHLTILKRYFISDETETIKFCLHVHFLGNFLLLHSLTDLKILNFIRKSFFNSGFANFLLATIFFRLFCFKDRRERI